MLAAVLEKVLLAVIVFVVVVGDVMVLALGCSTNLVACGFSVVYGLLSYLGCV